MVKALAGPASTIAHSPLGCSQQAQEHQSTAEHWESRCARHVGMSNGWQTDWAVQGSTQAPTQSGQGRIMVWGILDKSLETSLGIGTLD